MNKVYIVKVGPGIYAKSKMYGIYQDTTSNPLEAHLFRSEEEAYKVAKKAIRGEVLPYIFASEEDYNRDIDVLRANIEQIKRDRDDLLEIINKLKQK